jgi:hypothetical protein
VIFHFHPSVWFEFLAVVVMRRKLLRRGKRRVPPRNRREDSSSSSSSTASEKMALDLDGEDEEEEEENKEVSTMRRNPARKRRLPARFREDDDDDADNLLKRQEIIKAADPEERSDSSDESGGSEIDELDDLKDEEKDVLKIFLESANEGKLLSERDLKNKVNEAGINVRKSFLKVVPNFFPKMLPFKEIHKNRENYQTAFLSSFGTVQADLGFFPNKIARFNKEKAAFFLAVECSTTKLFAIPISNKSMTSLKNAIDKMIELKYFPGLKTIVMDREAGILSEQMRKFLTEKYGIRVWYMKRRNKAYLAERYIKYVKTYLSKLMAIKNSKKWIDKLEPAINYINTLKSPGTSFPRNEVNQKNFNAFLKEKYNVAFPSLMKNLADTHVSKLLYERRERGGKKVFKFNLGDIIIISKKGQGKLINSFKKPSIEGEFDKKPFKIIGRELRFGKKLQSIPGN